MCSRSVYAAASESQHTGAGNQTSIDQQTPLRTLPNGQKGHRVRIDPLEPSTIETILNQIATTVLLFRSDQVMTQAASVCYPQSDVLLERESIGGHADFGQ